MLKTPLIVVLLLLTVCLVPGFPARKYLQPTTGNPALDSLYAHNQIDTAQFDSLGFPDTFMGLMLARKTSDDPLARVYDFLEENEQIFQIANPREELRVVEDARKKSSRAKFTGFQLQQYHKGVPVFNAGIGAHVNQEGYISLIICNYRHGLKVDTNPLLNELQAQAALADSLQSDTKSCQFPDIRLGVFVRTDAAHLAWRMTAICPGGSGFYMLDAHTGAILSYDSGIVR